MIGCRTKNKLLKNWQDNKIWRPLASDREISLQSIYNILNSRSIDEKEICKYRMFHFLFILEMIFLACNCVRFLSNERDAFRRLRNCSSRLPLRLQRLTNLARIESYCPLASRTVVVGFYDQQVSFQKSEQGRTSESTRPEGQEKRTPRAREYHRSCQVDQGIQDDRKMYVLVGLRILHSYLIESSCTQYEKIDKLKCKLQAQKDYY